MKTFKRFFVLTLLAVAMALPASAQFRWGPKVGIEVNKMHFNKELGNSDNQTGFTGGLMAEIQVPIIGICVDGSVMYARRNVKLEEVKRLQSVTSSIFLSILSINSISRSSAASRCLILPLVLTSRSF